MKTMPPALKTTFIAITAAICGACIMIIEILGTRLLAPYFGSTHFVWMAEITVTMFALAIGYYLGGYVIDRKPNLCVTYAAIALAGVWTAVSGLLIASLAPYCEYMSPSYGSLVISFIAFFPSLVLLATVTPSLLRMSAVEVKTLGRTAGKISAISTLGSFLGTAAIGYVIIPIFANSTTLFLTATTLFLLSTIHFFHTIKGIRRRALTLTICAFAIWVSWNIKSSRTSPEHMRAVHVENSFYGEHAVYDIKNSGTRVFMNDSYPQNTIDTFTKQGGDFYPFALRELANLYLRKSPENLLMVGLGMGVGVQAFQEIGTKVDSIEVSPETVKIAQKFFNLSTVNHKIFIEDARTFLTKNKSQKSTYDCIVLDVFSGGGNIPNHLITREALLAMRHLLKPNGLLIFNTNLHPLGMQFMFGTFFKTLGSVFNNVAIHKSKGFNTFYIASDGNLDFAAPTTLHWNAPELIQSTVLHTVKNRIKRPESFPGIVLTDDFNPSDFEDAEGRVQMFRAIQDYWFKNLANN